MTGIPAIVNLRDGASATTTVVAPDSAEWTAADARRFVWDIWRLEFVADTGTAVTGPLRLSDRALERPHSAVFDLSAPGAVH